MQRKTLLALTFAAFTAFAGACGDSTAPNANLTQAQLDEMMDAMSAIGFGFTAAPGIGSAASRGTSNVISLTIDQDEPCPVSGTVNLKGNMSFNDAGTQFTMNMTETHKSCAATSAKTGKTWTFNGKPNVVANFTANITDPITGAGTFSGTEKGTIAFSTEGLSGQCSIDISITATTNAQGASTGTITGTVCGKDVSQQFSDPGV